MATPAKLRQSGIPGPSKASGIPTPGRTRSTSSAVQQTGFASDDEYVSRAFADAIRANDPAQHQKPSQPGPSFSARSVSSSGFQSGRRSAAGHPPASTFPASTTDRPKTPISARPPSRPPSRHSDTFGKTNNNKSFQVGDNVRIESLGYEGTVRYIGEIDGKPGLWAGVELAGGFAGKGKNNGSVNGKRYFSCPENCGVFVAFAKLSPPTVGPGAVPRSSSVASSRSGRITPMLSGRVTPLSASVSGTRVVSATSNGRIPPPGSGRTTPSMYQSRVSQVATPSSRIRVKSASTTHDPMSTLKDKISEGSRASKYLTASMKRSGSHNSHDSRDLDDLEDNDELSRSSPSPSAGHRHLSSPTRFSGSPLSTPKPVASQRRGTLSATPNKARSLTGTPRARVPSSVAMPPPASPGCVSATEFGNPKLVPELNLQYQRDVEATSHDRPRSVSSIRTTSDDYQVAIDQMQSRIDALEYDNERLRRLQNVSPASNENEAPGVDENETKILHRQLKDVESELAESKSLLMATSARLLSSEKVYQANVAALETEKQTSQARFEALQSTVDDEAMQLQKLENSLQEKEEALRRQEELLKAKDNDVVDLEQKVTNLTFELQNERVELGTQINELRMAGQETIALYEEKLNAATAQRYEFESRIAALETELRLAKSTNSASVGSANVSSATQIENETLREQVLHLQRKLSNVEDALEDSRASAEKEETAFQERMRRLREKEESMRKELNDGRRDMEHLVESETRARNRLEEVEEALRESTMALENARAEIETLRIELGNLEAPLSHGKPSQSNAPRNDASLAREEITGLKHIVQELQKENASWEQKLKIAESENEILLAETKQLRQQLDEARFGYDKKPHKARQNSYDDLHGDSDGADEVTRELTSLYESELEQLRKQLADSEMKAARTAHDLNKEISELEALVESKIYREDELEQELEQMKEKLARSKKSSKGGNEVVVREGERVVCEICEREGHDIFNCDLLKGKDGELYCDDCDSHGHLAKDCPHSLEVF